MKKEIAQLYMDAIRRGLVVGAPKDERDLRKQYPEFYSDNEFRGLQQQDLLFVFFYKCATSPFDGMEDAEKLKLSIRFAYQADAVRALREKEFAAGNFGDLLPAAFKAMERKNTAAHIINHQAILKYRDNCLAIITEDTTTMLPEQKTAYMTRAEKALLGLDLSTKKLENLGQAVIESGSSSVLTAIKGHLKDHRTAPRNTSA